MSKVEQAMEGAMGHVEDAQEGVEYAKEPTVRGRMCNMDKACKQEAEFTAVDNSPEAIASTDKGSPEGEGVTHDACEDHIGKIWRAGLQVIPINAHVQ